MIYGTAWKKEDTKHFALQAINAGFRAIDTANQPKHYHELGVGEALRESFDAGTLRRDELFLQTKFTYRAGQDERIPYDPKAPFPDQVRQSLESSLSHLGVSYVDSYILHGPLLNHGITETDLEVWQTMECLLDEGKVKSLGLSNTKLDQLQTLGQNVRIQPHFVQNRCFASTYWDRSVRMFCNENAIRYQGFSLLTANLNCFGAAEFEAVCTKHQKTFAQVIYRFADQVGMMPLCGSKTRTHLDEALNLESFTLAPTDVSLIEKLIELPAPENASFFQKIRSYFQS